MPSASLSLFALFFSIAIVGSFLVLVHDVIERWVLRAQDRLASASLASSPAPHRSLPLLFLGSVFTRRNVVVVSSRRLALRHLSAPLRVVMLLVGKVVIFVDDETGSEFMEDVVLKARFDRCIVVRNALGQYPARARSIAARLKSQGREGARLFVDYPQKRARRPVAAERVTTSN